MIDQVVANAHRIVIKTGSALIADGKSGVPRTNWLGYLADDVARLRSTGKQIVLVTSGAIALGWPKLGYKQRPKKLEDKQAAAAGRQPQLMQAFDAAFSDRSMQTAQTLLTIDDTERRRRWLNARATLDVLLGRGIIRSSTRMTPSQQMKFAMETMIGLRRASAR